MNRKKIFFKLGAALVLSPFIAFFGFIAYLWYQIWQTDQWQFVTSLAVAFAFTVAVSVGTYLIRKSDP